MRDIFQTDSHDIEDGPSPHQIIQAIIEQGKSGNPLAARVRAITFARRHGWKSIETEEYARLGMIVVQQKTDLDAPFVETLCSEIGLTDLTEETYIPLRTLLAAMGKIPADDRLRGMMTDAFIAKLDDRASAWNARVMLGGFLDKLESLDEPRGGEMRRRLTNRITDWVIEYHVSDGGKGFDVRTQGMFNALCAAAWSQDAAENVVRGLDGAFECAVDKLTQGAVAPWFRSVVDDLIERLAPMKMFRRVTPETLYRIGERLAGARRQLYQEDPGAALAITSLEDAIHRPHRKQLDRSSMRLELELPGPRGFAEGTRLRVFDISRDGCLAVTDGPARFEEIAPPVEAPLERGHDRSFRLHKLSGVVRQSEGGFTVKPGIELILHDASRSREWAAIDGASVVRVTPDEKNNRLWLGFHFDRIVPEVQQELEALVYGAA